MRLTNEEQAMRIRPDATMGHRESNQGRNLSRRGGSRSRRSSPYHGRHGIAWRANPEPRRPVGGCFWIPGSPRAAPRNDEESFFSILLDDLLRLVVGLAVATQRGWLRSGIERLQARRDLGVLALEQAVSGEVAFDQERTEPLHVEHPHGLRQAQFLQPIHAGNPLDAAPEQRPGSVSDRGEVDRVIGNEEFAVDLGGHPALADNDVAAGKPKPAVEPTGKSK